MVGPGCRGFRIVGEYLTNRQGRCAKTGRSKILVLPTLRPGWFRGCVQLFGLPVRRGGA